MSVETDSPSATRDRDRGRGIPNDKGGGWLTFAGILLIIAGVINFIGGLAAIDDSKFFVADTKYVLGDLNTWGWVILILGAVQVLTGFGLFARNSAARAVGVVFAGLNATVQLLMLPAYPLWSLAIFTMDILIIYGLVTYGSDEA